MHCASYHIAESGKRPVDSLFVLAQSGTLVEYLLEPRARPSSEKVTDESQLDLGVTGRMQWNLQRYTCGFYYQCTA